MCGSMKPNICHQYHKSFVKMANGCGTKCNLKKVLTPLCRLDLKRLLKPLFVLACPRLQHFWAEENLKMIQWGQNKSYLNINSYNFCPLTISLCFDQRDFFLLSKKIFGNEIVNGQNINMKVKLSCFYEWWSPLSSWFTSADQNY